MGPASVEAGDVLGWGEGAFGRGFVAHQVQTREVTQRADTASWVHRLLPDPPSSYPCGKGSKTWTR